MNSLRYTLFSCLILSIAFSIAFFYTFSNEKEYSLGLDIAGGTRLTYTADPLDLDDIELKNRVSALESVIDSRINALGVSEPRIYTQENSIFAKENTYKLIVELPGVTDIEEAVRAIGKTPFLEFKILNEDGEFVDSGINGGHISSASTSFLQGASGQLTNEPIVLINFNGEGASLFADLTKENVGNIMGIFLDGEVISSPVIRDVILGGTTQITGNFTIDTATELSESISFGALPIPIELSETTTVSPTLGQDVIDASIFVAILVIIAITLFFLLVYRFSGLLASIALAIYIIIVLAIFKFIPVVLTAAGIAGFVMSIGFAVDANVLIFERMREQMKEGKDIKNSIKDGFPIAWIAIKDSNTTSIIIAIVLWWFGTSIIKGFAFTFIIGVIVSMLTAYLITRVFLIAFSPKNKNKFFLW